MAAMNDVIRQKPNMVRRKRFFENVPLIMLNNFYHDKYCSKNKSYLIGRNFVGRNFRRAKLFVGRNFRHFSKNSSLSPDKVSPDKVDDSGPNDARRYSKMKKLSLSARYENDE